MRAIRENAARSPCSLRCVEQPLKTNGLSINNADVVSCSFPRNAVGVSARNAAAARRPGSANRPSPGFVVRNVLALLLRVIILVQTDAPPLKLRFSGAGGILP